jgi:hypothetical protein
MAADRTAHQNRERERRPPPGWAKLREQILDRDGHRCTIRGSTEQLEIHHVNGWRDNRHEALEVRCFAHNPRGSA